MEAQAFAPNPTPTPIKSKHSTLGLSFIGLEFKVSRALCRGQVVRSSGVFERGAIKQRRLKEPVEMVTVKEPID